MPLPYSVPQGSRRSVRGFLHRVLQRPVEAPEPQTPVQVSPDRVDAATRTYWARGQMSPATLVEAPARQPSATRQRMSALLRDHERGAAATGRPRGNPAFSEALFVELMRAKQYRRAFEQLSRDCRSRWGSADAFAAAQGAAMRRLQGVQVKDVRFLPEWTDPAAGRSYRDVAELDVEYTIAGQHRPHVIARVVHLVPDEGKWRSLCYPG